MSDAAIQPGQVLAGKYQVERVLGRGGMGVVLAARHLVIGRPVAIKLMTALGFSGADLEARFFREARVGGMLKSEHAGKVRDCGRLEDGAPYIEMELLEGQDLGALLKTRGALTVEEAVSYLLQACEAIAEAHAAGIVHRDLKPANLFLEKHPTVGDRIKVLDFGIAKLFDADSKLTRTDQSFGSPRYMSPEQFRSAKYLDPRSDVWALGIILYELLTETTPFEADSPIAIGMRAVRDDPAPPSELRPDLPAGLVAAIMRCIQKDPARRFQNVAELAQALGPFAPPHMVKYVGWIAKAGRVELVAAPPPPVPPAPASAAAMTPPVVSEGAGLATGAGLMRAANAPAAPKGRAGMVVASLGALVVGGVAAAALMRGGTAPSAAPGAPASASTLVPVITATASTEPVTPAASATPTVEPAASASAGPGPRTPAPPVVKPPAVKSTTPSNGWGPRH